MVRLFQYQRVKYLVLLALSSVVLLQPLRLVFLSLLMPQTWVDTDTTHLYRVMYDFQNFEVDSKPLAKDAAYSRVQANMSRFPELVKAREKAYPEFHHYLDILHFQAKEDNSDALMQKLRVLNTFKPILTPVEGAQLIFALETFVKACREAGLTFFILEASLMGVIRHHGLIPWDDDIDIVMRASEWPKIRNVLGNIDGFELFTPRDSQWKFYAKDARSFPDKPFKFPNLDIFFFGEDDTHIWALTKGLKHDLVYKKSDIFPLNWRPFEHLMVPVPCNLDLVVHKAHDKNVCITPEYIHKTNERFYLGGKTAIDCKLLHGVYPFVSVSKSSRPGYDEERLKIGPREIHRRLVPAVCAG
ncbi:lipopolysaccharide cholinephosphotransferase licd [Plakobranchus ocellatus]|uniref:Lipopolysaccharide cholinephosphotransferase licd n=1 Tax=Plakobranchus ocellatus TaxID=259542 RepID=A0AAV4C010_9GAST|nr:lipopolysaccharide cholinephosphotransferase licd [Plakobranchus ocellatus]